MSDDDTAAEAKTVPASAGAEPLDYDRLGEAVVDALERRGYFSKLSVDEAVDFNLKVMAKLAQAGTAAQAINRALGDVARKEGGAGT